VYDFRLQYYADDILALIEVTFTYYTNTQIPKQYKHNCIHLKHKHAVKTNTATHKHTHTHTAQ